MLVTASSYEPAAGAAAQPAEQTRLAPSLVDAAMALEWNDFETSHEKLALVSTDYFEPSALPQTQVARDTLPNHSSRASTAAKLNLSIDEAKDAQEVWLSENLLERVFS